MISEGAPALPKLTSESLSESMSFFGGLRDRKVTPNGTRTGPGGTQIDVEIMFFLGAEFWNEFWSEHRRQVFRTEAEPGPGGTLLDHESIILRYLEV